MSDDDKPVEFKLHSGFSRAEIVIEDSNGVPIEVTWTGYDTFEVHPDYAANCIVKRVLKPRHST